MMPDPEPAPWLPSTSSSTTDGSTFWATCSTGSSPAGESGVSTTCEAVGAAPLPDGEPLPPSSRALNAAAPPTPAAPPTTRAAATSRAPKRAAAAGTRWGRVVGGCWPYPKGPSGAVGGGGNRGC